MKKHFAEHYLYHLSLVLILVLGFASFVRLSGMIRIYILFFAIFSYVGVGILHHRLNHTLVGKIVIEYILVGLLCASIALFILRGGLGI